MKTLKTENGQVLAEFVYTLVMAISVVAVLLILLTAFTEYGWRISVLIGWEPGT